MKSAKTLLIAITLLGLSIAVLAFAKAAPPQNVTLQDAEPGSIDEMIVQALAIGQTQVTTAIDIEHEEVPTFDEAKRSYSILVARADSKQSFISNPFEISTWFRFTVTETLSMIPPHLCVNNRCAPPYGVAAAGGSEMLVPRSGGTVFKDGVTVNLLPDDFPDFILGQSYLLFVDYDSSTRVGAPALGPIGVFFVNSNGTLTALLASSDLKNDIAARFGNSLAQIRTALSSSTPSSGCSTTTEQNCYSVGGEWDSSTCSCFRDPCLKKPWLCE